MEKSTSFFTQDFTCDGCGKHEHFEGENSIGNPEGWKHGSFYNGQDTLYADWCSEECFIGWYVKEIASYEAKKMSPFPEKKA